MIARNVLLSSCLLSLTLCTASDLIAQPMPYPSPPAYYAPSPAPQPAVSPTPYLPGAKPVPPKFISYEKYLAIWIAACEATYTTPDGLAACLSQAVAAWYWGQADADGDGLNNDWDGAPNDPDRDDDGILDGQDPDRDGDGIENSLGPWPW